MEDFLKLQKNRENSLNSWSKNIDDTDEKNFDLSVENPNAPKIQKLRSPKELLEEMEKTDQHINNLLNNLKELL